MGQTDVQRLIILLEAAAATCSYDSNPKLWDEVLAALNLDICYQLTIADVLQRGTWRKAADVKAYVASSAVRSARGKNLPDYFEKEFRRVTSHGPETDKGTVEDSAAGQKLEEYGGGGVYERTASGAIRYVDEYASEDYYEQIPGWLQRGGEYDAVDWETIAAYAVLKPKMACQLARVLIMRLELGLGRPEAMARAASPEEASAIEATWKWIDRNKESRIAPLFKMEAPPRPLAATDIESFPALGSGVTLRVDVQPIWNGGELILMRTGIIPDSDGPVPAWSVEAESEAAAMDVLRADARKGDKDEDSDLFHFWTIQPGEQPVQAAKPSGQAAFPRPWDVLSRVGAKPAR